MKPLALLLALTLPAAAQTISPHAIEAHMRFLADDLLEGRETGTRGYDIAAQYVMSQFDAAGLETSLQPVAFRTSIIKEQSLRVGDVEYTPRKDFVLAPSFDGAEVNLTAPVAVAGYGIVAPQAHHDDYKMVDVRGRVVLLLSGAPASFGIDERAYYSSRDLKYRTAAQHGAIGVLLVNSRTDERRTPFERMARQDALPSMRYLEDGKPADLPGLRITGRISYDVARKLMGEADIAFDTMLREADQNATYSLPLKSEVVIHATSAQSDAQSANVVGIVRGSDPKLRDQYIVSSAHLDHLGNHERAGTSDRIYNGAQDNASGIAVLIEVAKAIAKNPPKRSVLFVAVTGEEKGEQGSLYFARHPTVPKSAIVADINMDMPLMLYPQADIIALGGEHSGLGPLAKSAAAAEKLEISPDPLPEEVRFIRSDQFSFVQEGIPAIHMKSGPRSTDPSIDANAVTREWLRTIYHTPADDMAQKLDFNAGAKYAQATLRLVRAAADSPQRVQWNRGDFFGSLFAK